MEQNVGRYMVNVWDGNKLHFGRTYSAYGWALRAAQRMTSEGMRWEIKVRTWRPEFGCWGWETAYQGAA